jgi:hypothetical protein
MKCPQCRLENPESALQCDCGHEFAAAFSRASSARPAQAAMADSPASLYLRSIDSSLRTIRIVVLAWATLTVIGRVYWLLTKQ